MISPDHQSSSQNPKPFRYFSPGKLVFLIQRLSDWGASSEDASQTYEAEIKARLLENPAIQNVEGLSQALQSATLNQRLTLAPDGTGGVLELVSFSGDVDDETLLRFVEAVTDYVTDPSQDEDSAIDIADWLLTLIKAQPAVSDLRVLGLAPNWYFGGAGQADPDQDGTGGPGGQPVRSRSRRMRGGRRRTRSPLRCRLASTCRRGWLP